MSEVIGRWKNEASLTGIPLLNPTVTTDIEISENSVDGDVVVDLSETLGINESWSSLKQAVKSEIEGYVDEGTVVYDDENYKITGGYVHEFTNGELEEGYMFINDDKNKIKIVDKDAAIENFKELVFNKVK